MAEMRVLIEQLGSPVDLRPQFGPQRRSLLTFLHRLAPEDWALPTACEGWDVADLFAHVVGDTLGRVSGLRDDSDRVMTDPNETLGRFIDRTNDRWVIGAKRLSSQLMIELAAWAGEIHDELWLSKDMHEPGLGVSWAGVDPAPVWFDAAREISEYWVHERQLREAVGNSDMGEPSLDTVLDVFARGLPYTLGRADLGDTKSVSITVVDSEVSWSLERKGERWWFVAGSSAADARLSFGGELLWRRWTRQQGSGLELETDQLAERAILEHLAIVHSSA
jgi:uncharacterized protein (TIGR03083 family)